VIIPPMIEVCHFRLEAYQLSPGDSCQNSSVGLDIASGTMLSELNPYPIARYMTLFGWGP